MHVHGGVRWADRDDEIAALHHCRQRPHIQQSRLGGAPGRRCAAARRGPGDGVPGPNEGGTDGGEVARISFAWSENQNFITSTFATTFKNVNVGGGTIGHTGCAKSATFTGQPGDNVVLTVGGQHVDSVTLSKKSIPATTAADFASA